MNPYLPAACLSVVLPLLAVDLSETTIFRRISTGTLEELVGGQQCFQDPTYSSCDTTGTGCAGDDGCTLVQSPFGPSDNFYQCDDHTDGRDIETIGDDHSDFFDDPTDCPPAAVGLSDCGSFYTPCGLVQTCEFKCVYKQSQTKYVCNVDSDEPKTESIKIIAAGTYCESPLSD